MSQFLSNKIIAGIVALALLVGVGVLISSGDTSSTTRNAALVAGTPCTKVGQVTKVSKQAVVCAALSPKNIWYPVFQEKKWICAKLGITRKQNGIFSVCGKNKSSKKRWFLTKPLMANSNPGLPTTDQDAFIKLKKNPELIVETSPTTPLALAVTTETPATETTLAVTTVTTLAPAVPATLSLVTQPLGGVNATALETQPVVQLLDQRGASNSTAGITITAVSGRTDVALSGNTAVTDATGRAIFKTLSLTGIMGDITLTFTTPGLEGITSDKFVLAAGAATQLVNSTTIGSVVSGKAFDQQPVLHFEDSSANVIAASGTDVIVTSSSQGLSGATTVATNKKGIAGFTDLALTQAGATTLTFTSGELSTTSEVTVVAGDYTTVKITTEASQAASNNTAFSQFPVVQLVDANNNKVATAGITVTVTITQFPTADTDKVATLLINTTATDAQGVATFTGLGIEGLIGTYTLGYTPTNGATQASEKTTTLSAGVATQLIVLTSPAGPVGDDAAGTWSLTQSPVIGLRDISNNPVRTSGVGVTATVSKQNQGYAAQTDTQGEATIRVIFSGDSAGDRTITYSALGLQTNSTTITLPLLTPVAQAWVLPTDKTTTSPAFILTPPTSSSNGAWAYTSSDRTIATVTAGTTTPQGVAGTTTITATQAATAKYADTTSTANLVIVNLCARDGYCSVGETGPGGGIVFYDLGRRDWWGQYLEVAPTNLGSMSWGCNGIFDGQPETGIGFGNTNTAEILDVPTSTNESIEESDCDFAAGRFAAGYRGGGYSNWFLPSRDELNELCKYARQTNQAEGGRAVCSGGTLRSGFEAGPYWSSSGGKLNMAWAQNFSNGDQGDDNRSGTYYVVPVRAF